MSLVVEHSATTLLRDRRRALRDERARVVYWRRLVRARLDVALAVITIPDAPGLDAHELLGPAGGSDVPRHVELLRALGGCLPMAEVHQLESLRDLDERLSRYEAEVDYAFAEATDRFVEHLSHHPHAAFDGTSVQPDRG